MLPVTDLERSVGHPGAASSGVLHLDPQDARADPDGNRPWIGQDETKERGSEGPD